MFFSANTLNFSSTKMLREIERLLSSDQPQTMIELLSTMSVSHPPSL